MVVLKGLTLAALGYFYLIMPWGGHFVEPAFDMKFGTVTLCHVAKNIEKKFKMAVIQMMM